MQETQSFTPTSSAKTLQVSTVYELFSLSVSIQIFQSILICSCTYSRRSPINECLEQVKITVCLLKFLIQDNKQD